MKIVVRPIANAIGLVTSIGFVVMIVAGFMDYIHTERMTALETDHAAEIADLQIMHLNEMREAVDQAVIHEQELAYGQFGAEVHMLAVLLVGEIGQHREEWIDVFSAVIGRVESPLFPDSIEEVVKQLRPNSTLCQIDAMCDRKMELMVTDQGLAAIAFAHEQLTNYYNGTFVPSIKAHSWATPIAAEGHGYFECLVLVAKRQGHNYYTGSCNPYAVMTSLRPKARPTATIEVAQN